jgi:hypothetical protein
MMVDADVQPTTAVRPGPEAGVDEDNRRSERGPVQLLVISRQVRRALGQTGDPQLLAITHTDTRTEMLARQLGDRLPRQWTFPLFLVPAIVVVVLTDVTAVVALASRVFAAYYLLQALIAGQLAWRARRWGWVVFFTGIGLAMAVVAVFGIPS